MDADISISVRSLVEYSLRSGSIGFMYQSAGLSRAQEGAVLHRKIQKKRELAALSGGWIYEREVSFLRTFTKGIAVTVRGRADGILKKDGSIFIEEIKTTEAPLAQIEENEQHIAQAKCYAYFYLLENGGEHISVLLTYINALTLETKEFEYTIGFEELELFFDNIFEKYVVWAKFIISCRQMRDASITPLSFPYESYRKLQREMCVLVYRAVESKKPVFINAPTGTGKTISTLFPAIKALPEKKADKIFYLTAKTITRKTALDAVTLMSQKGLLAKSMVITAKEKACFLEKAVCDPTVCKYAAGHFDRVNGAVHDALKNENILTKDIVSFYAETHTVCPYELSLDLALYSDIIICDYNYAFDPRAYLRRFFAETRENYVFLIDEAHNLVDRAREMYSAELSSSVLKAAESKIGKRASVLKKLVSRLADGISELADKITDEDYGITLDLPKPFLNDIRAYCQAADRWLTDNRAGKRYSYYDTIMELYFEFNHFLSISDVYDEKYVFYCEREQKGAKVKLFCTDPSGRMSAMLLNAASAVFFSATLTPPDYFKRLLGAKDEDAAYTLPSPFPRENLKVTAVAGISAKYHNRRLFYEDIADYIYAAVQIKPGNYFAFFPSYAYLECVYRIFEDKYPEVETSVQTPDMKEHDKEAFLDRFIERENTVFVSFAVFGQFSEGVDLPGKKLIGAFIISVGLPMLSFERMLISKHFDAVYGNGFEYSYMFPGMNKVLQAGGRVIRSHDDKGIIVLIDERFSLNSYRRLFPDSWSGFEIVRGVEAFKRSLTDFWE